MEDMDWLCQCTGDIPIDVTFEHIEYAPLKSRQHTSFTPMICGKCGKISAMPIDNFRLFLKEGEPELVECWSRQLQTYVTRKTSKSSKWKFWTFAGVAAYCIGSLEAKKFGYDTLVCVMDGCLIGGLGTLLYYILWRKRI